MRILPALAACAVLAMPGFALAETQATISVTGEGKVMVTPDMATISLGVTVNGATAKEALDANSAALANVLEKLKASGVDEKDIQTTGLSLGPMFDYSGSGSAQSVTGYSASNLVTVQVRAIDQVGPILDASVTDGANVLNGISFGLQDPVPASDEARKAAVADAKRKAELLAEAAGVTLGPVLSISENGNYMPPMPMMAGYAKADSVPVAAGSMEVGMAVTVTYTIAE